jgi:hypothetical protein
VDNRGTFVGLLHSLPLMECLSAWPQGPSLYGAGAPFSTFFSGLIADLEQFVRAFDRFGVDIGLRIDP